MKSAKEIAQYLIDKGVIKDEYINNDKPFGVLIAIIADALDDKLNESNMKKSLNESKLRSLISKLIREELQLKEEQPTEKEIASLEDLQKKLKGLKSLLAKVPDDVKPKVDAKIKQVQKQVASYLAATSDTEASKAKTVATSDIKKSL